MSKYVKRLVCLMLMVSAFSAQAATRTWLGVSGNWTNQANWAGGALPGVSDVADLTAATGVVDLTADVTVGEIAYNPVFGGTTNTLTILSDTAAPSSRTVTLTTTLTNHVQVGEGAELLMDADLKPTGNVRKDGQGSLVVRRRLFAAALYNFDIEQGRVVNEGTITSPGIDMRLGTLGTDAGAAPEFVMRDGSSYNVSSTLVNSSLRLGCNKYLGAGAGGLRSRALFTHEGGVMDLTTNKTGGTFVNGYSAGGADVYNLTGGEVRMRAADQTAYVGFSGTGTVNQTGGKLTVATLSFSHPTAAGGRGTYNLTGGELWFRIAQKGAGTAAFNLGGGCLYPLSTGFTVNGDTNPKLTGINGMTRFCSTGSGFTNTVSGLTGTGGFVKEGADTLNLAGTVAHTFTGPVIVSNGTVNVSSSMTGGNAVLVAGGSLNLNAVYLVSFSSLMVSGGVFQVASNCGFVITGTDPWARVAGTGTIRLLDGASLLCLAVSEAGVIDLSAGGTSTVYRLALDGVEQAPGFYTASNCAAISGTGTLAVILQKDGRILSDTFTRADGATSADSLGETEAGGADWAEFLPSAPIGDAASVTNGELRLGVGTSDPGLALTAATWPNGLFSTRMRFGRVGASGATVKNACGLLLRRSISGRSGSTAIDWAGAVHVLMTPAGGLFLRENYSDNKYTMNPFTGGDYLTYGAAGSLPTSINGAPFDADGDGRLGSDEPFDLKAILSGARLQVLINGEPVMAYNGFAAPGALAENCAGFFKNRLSQVNDETHDSYHDDFAVTNLPFLIRHTGLFDPDVAAAAPRENWGFSGSTTLVSVAAVTETVGGETVEAWKVDDASTADGSVGQYNTTLSAQEIAGVNTNRWRFTMRLRVVKTNDAVDYGVSGQVATTTRAFTLHFGSDASGNALVKLNSGAAVTVPGGSVYHTYSLEYNPGKTNANLFCDGALLNAGVTGGTVSLNRIIFGANSSAAMGSAHYQLVQFEFLPPPPIPPPGTLIRVR